MKVGPIMKYRLALVIPGVLILASTALIVGKAESSQTPGPVIQSSLTPGPVVRSPKFTNDSPNFFDKTALPTDGPPVTVPGTPGERNTDADEMSVRSFANHFKVDQGTATELLDLQDDLAVVATEATKKYSDIVAGFRFESTDSKTPMWLAFEGPVPPNVVRTLFDVHADRVRLFPNSISLVRQQELRDQGLREGFGVYYDPFSSELTIFTDKLTTAKFSVPNGTRVITKTWDAAIKRENATSYGGLVVWENSGGWKQTCTQALE
jgi:hypothetical protein